MRICWLLITFKALLITRCVMRVRAPTHPQKNRITDIVFKHSSRKRSPRSQHACWKMSLDFALFSHCHLPTPSVSSGSSRLPSKTISRTPISTPPRRHQEPANPPSRAYPEPKPNLDESPSSCDYLLPLHACLGFSDNIFFNRCPPYNPNPTEEETHNRNIIHQHTDVIG
uniref:Secreted protein n=1 Tax=Anopheles funestus TaxID=62324 RepID=A0A182S140_ANOFN